MRGGPQITRALGREKLIGQRGLPGTGKSWLGRNVGYRAAGNLDLFSGLGNWLAITWASNLAVLALGEGAWDLRVVPSLNRKKKKRTIGRKMHTNLLPNTLPLWERTKSWEGWPAGFRWQARDLSFLCQSRGGLISRAQPFSCLLSMGGVGR